MWHSSTKPCSRFVFRGIMKKQRGCNLVFLLTNLPLRKYIFPNADFCQAALRGQIPRVSSGEGGSVSAIFWIMFRSVPSWLLNGDVRHWETLWVQMQHAGRDVLNMNLLLIVLLFALNWSVAWKYLKWNSVFLVLYQAFWISVLRLLMPTFDTEQS